MSPDLPLPSGEGDSRQAAQYATSDVTPPPQRFEDDAGDRGLHPLVATIADHGRRFEAALSDLEQSLTALFATQIETLQRLRDQARDHDRRWAEQAANRRASFAPP